MPIFHSPSQLAIIAMAALSFCTSIRVYFHGCYFHMVPLTSHVSPAAPLPGAKG